MMDEFLDKILPTYCDTDDLQYFAVMMGVEDHPKVRERLNQLEKDNTIQVDKECSTSLRGKCTFFLFYLNRSTVSTNIFIDC